ncbi:MAG TPA: hypothetical protein DCG33_04100, partial [Prevotellaceae bacterium]|nr:hypothetical protein [Prevotellaceae bacterium]
SRFRNIEQEHIYRMYVTDALMDITGGEGAVRYADLFALHETNEVDAEALAKDIIDRCGLVVIG